MSKPRPPISAAATKRRCRTWLKLFLVFSGGSAFGYVFVAVFVRMVDFSFALILKAVPPTSPRAVSSNAWPGLPSGFARSARGARSMGAWGSVVAAKSVVRTHGDTLERKRV